MRQQEAAMELVLSQVLPVKRQKMTNVVCDQDPLKLRRSVEHNGVIETN